jgi:hypothetical protein
MQIRVQLQPAASSQPELQQLVPPLHRSRVQPRCWQQQKQQKQQIVLSDLEMLEVALTSLTDCWVAQH